jgi:hypothetical protein
MSSAALFPRYLSREVREALLDSPVVLVNGPRQCGKTTLVKLLGTELGYYYVSFDDEVQRASAQRDPVGFLDLLRLPVVLDEVQMVPNLFPALKRVVDSGTANGQFLLTGSASVMLVPQLTESLAGRIDMFDLRPLSQDEIAGRESSFLADLFQCRFSGDPSKRLGESLLQRVVNGGYPRALARSTAGRKSKWYRDYVTSIIQRDVQSLAQIRSLEALERLVQLAAGQTAHLFVASDLAAPLQVTRPTVQSWTSFLERVFLLERLPPWHSNQISRLTKTPKLYVGDSGLACALLGIGVESLRRNPALRGQMIETFVVQELRRQATWHPLAHRFFHFRSNDGIEVDVVLEREDGMVAAVEVKAGATVGASDFRGLRKLAQVLQDRFAAGVVLFDGERPVPFGDRLLAVPIRHLWG